MNWTWLGLITAAFLVFFLLCRISERFYKRSSIDISCASFICRSVVC